MTEEIIIDVTKCDFNTFDGGGSQRTICTLDNCYCDGIRAKDCYYKQLKRLEQENRQMKSALEEIRAILNKECGIISNAKAVGIINEVLGNEGN